MRTRHPISEAEILATLEQCRGDVTAAAQLLDMSSRTLYRRMAEFGIRAHRTYRPLIGA